MTLFSLRDRLIAEGPSTAFMLAKKLDADPGMVESMLDHWIRRGRVEVVDGGCHTGGLCRTCGACSLSALHWYRWSAAESSVRTPHAPGTPHSGRRSSANGPPR